MVWDPQDKPANDNGCGSFAFYLGLSVGAGTVLLSLGCAWALAALFGG